MLSPNHSLTGSIRGIPGGRPLNKELREAPQWWIATLRMSTDRRTWFHGPKPVAVYVDAAGCGHLGVTIYADGQVLTFPTRIPWRMIEAACDIFDMEMCACLYGVRIVADLIPNRAVLLCCANRGATGALGRGACRSEFSLKICDVFWNLAASKMIPAWIEEVAGKLNPSDPLPGAVLCGNSSRAIQTVRNTEFVSENAHL